jgi:hypothetical protein
MSNSSESISTTAVTIAAPKSSQPSAETPPNVAEEGKPVQAYRMKMQGFTAERVAKSMGVCERTVYRWFEQHKEEYATQLQSQPAVNVLAEHVSAFEEYERLAQRDYWRASGNRDRHSFLKAAIDARQRIIDLQLKVGVLPSSPSQLHVSVQDTSPLAGLAEKETSLSREELQVRLVELLGNPNQLPPLTLPDEGYGYGDTENESE